MNRGGWKRAALAAGLALAAQGGALRNGFVWDDHVAIEANPFLRDAANVRVLLTPGFWLGRRAVQGGARPVFLASLLGDRALWGDAPRGWHATSLVLHAADAALVGALAAEFGAGAAAATAAALLFAVHPITTEAVEQIAFRADLLAALFVLLGLWSWLRGRRARSQTARALGAAGALAALALGALSKESALVLPILIASAEAFRRRGGRRLPVRPVLAASAAAGLLIGGYLAFRAPRSGYKALTGARTLFPAVRAKGVSLPSPPAWNAIYRSPRARAMTASSVLLDDLRLLAVPYPLIADRAPLVPASPRQPRAWAGFLLAVALAAAAWGLRRRSPAAGLGLCWTLAALLPVSGVVPLYNPIAERYLYMPAIGACLAAAALLELASASPAGRRGLLAALLLPALLISTRRSRDWRDDAALFRRAGAAGTSPRALYNRAYVRQSSGRLREAADDYRRALARDPRSVEAMVNLAAIEESFGRVRGAEELLRRAVAQNPASALPYHALGRLLLKSGGRAAEARRQLERALESAPDDPSILADLAAALAALGQDAQAASRLSAAAGALAVVLSSNPYDAQAAADLGVYDEKLGRLRDAYSWLSRAMVLRPASAGLRFDRAVVLERLGEWGKAADDLERAVGLDPSHAKAWQELGVVRQALNLPGPASDAYRKAVSLDATRFQSWTNLGGLLLREGRLDEAEEALRRARALAPDDPIVLTAVSALLLRRGDVGAACASLKGAFGRVNAKPYDAMIADAIRARLASCESLRAARAAAAGRGEPPSPQERNK